jgi:hypothetical protein
MKIEVKNLFKDEIDSTYDVFCGWGEGPDVGINLQRKAGSHTHYSDLDFVPMDFTADQAEALGKALLNAAEEARRWDRELNAYFENERLRQGTDEVADVDDFEGSGSTSKAVGEDTKKPL